MSAASAPAAEPLETLVRRLLALQDEAERRRLLAGALAAADVQQLLSFLKAEAE